VRNQILYSVEQQKTISHFTPITPTNLVGYSVEQKKSDLDAVFSGVI